MEVDVVYTVGNVIEYSLLLSAATLMTRCQLTMKVMAAVATASFELALCAPDTSRDPHCREFYWVQPLSRHDLTIHRPKPAESRWLSMFCFLMFVVRAIDHWQLRWLSLLKTGYQLALEYLCD